jgi:DNA-binding NtrC family response regulator
VSARTILLVDDDVSFHTKVRETLGGAYFVTSVLSEAEFHQEFRPYTFDLIILDMRLESEREGLALLREILAYDELQPVIIVSSYGDTDAVLSSVELGALMFLHKQEFTPELLARMVEAILQQAHVQRHLVALQRRVPSADSLVLAGKNATARHAADLAQRAADDPQCIVLVAGEHGTGHELVAQLIHDGSSSRADAPLVTANGLRMWGEEDSRTVLFGSRAQSAKPRRKGLLEQANRGVLFLDRMEVLDVSVRASLGEVLRTRTLAPDQNDLPIPLNIQFVAGTAPEGAEIVAADLRAAAGGNRLFEIYLPPLRERREDIPLLAAFFLGELRQEGRTSARTLSRDALAALEAYAWPGNLPELRNTVEFGAIKAQTIGSQELALNYLPPNLVEPIEPEVGGRWDYRYHLARAEVALAHRVLEQEGALSKTQLAKILGYRDRFAFARRVRNALLGFPDIAREFPRVSGMFRIAV